MRRGIILSMNKSARIGLISDINDQHIYFKLDDQSFLPKRGQIISFEIRLINGILMAVDISPAEFGKDADLHLFSFGESNEE
ncbi:hypothetical protein [Pedobacter aquatilis]|uniref:hypothetical protein n=1 Tax=Pedobacter aquatilis TaxID=351343 RepID=UPI00292F83DE|nr:hypothetical protein [Pedobacter aquatilis]